MPTGTDDKIRALTKGTLTDILRFDVSYRVARYVEGNALDDFRNFEELLHADEYPIRGMTLRLTQADAVAPLFLEEVALAPDQVTSEFNRFPFEATAAAYLFTLMELHGEELIALLPNAPDTHNRLSWHAGVSADLRPHDRQQLIAQRRALAKSLGLPDQRIDVHVIVHLARLKEARNEFVHRGWPVVNYDDFRDSVISVVALLFFASVPSQSQIVIAPWDTAGSGWDDRW